MTVVEFLHPLKDSSIPKACLAGLYFAQRYEQKESLTVEELRAVLKRGRFPKHKANLADALAKSAPNVDAVGKKGKAIQWSLTPSGEREVRKYLGLPEADVEIEHDVSTLEKLVSGLSDKDIADYIRESITCLSVGALRAAVVFLWEGAVRDIQKRVMAKPIADVNAALQKHDTRSKQVKKLDDLEYIKEKVLILATEDLGIFDKSERTTLEQALDLRNKCGHPAKYNPGPKKASSFIEDVVGIVFK